MALKTSRSNTRALRPSSHRLSRKEEVETHFLFDFDDQFFSAYADFLDRLRVLCIRHHSELQDPFAVLLTLLSPCMVVDIMLHEEAEDMSLSESCMDALYGELENDPLSEDVIEELTEFYNANLKPFGFWQILDITKRNDGFYLEEFIGVREENTMVYTLKNYH